jgi:hypothetical protein
MADLYSNYSHLNQVSEEEKRYRLKTAIQLYQEALDNMIIERQENYLSTTDINTKIEEIKRKLNE